MTSTAVEIHNTRKEDIEKSGEGKNIHNDYPKKSFLVQHRNCY